MISEVGNESQFIKEIPGEFIDRSNFLILKYKEKNIVKCSKCSKDIEESFNYCPYCGKICSDYHQRLENVKLDYPQAYESRINTPPSTMNDYEMSP